MSVEIDLEDESCNPRCKGAERGKSGPPNNDADKGHRHRSGDGKDGDDCGC